MRKLLFVFLVYASCATCLRAQFYFYPGITAGYSYQRVHMAEVGATVYWAQPLQHEPVMGVGLSLASGVGGYLGKFVVAPRVAVTGLFYFIGARSCYTYFTDFEKDQSAYSLEGGINILGKFYLYAGRTWTLSEPVAIPVNSFTCSIGINYFLE